MADAVAAVAMIEKKLPAERLITGPAGGQHGAGIDRPEAAVGGRVGIAAQAPCGVLIGQPVVGGRWSCDHVLAEWVAAIAGWEDEPLADPAEVGGIDTQDLLVNASPQEIKDEVRRLKDVFGENLVVSPSHEAVLPNVPLKNIEADSFIRL